MTQDRIGFIGTGNMGGPMATRLLDAGIPLTICDRDPGRVAPLREKGAMVADSPRDLADRAEIIFASLTTPAICHDVALGAEGIAKGKAIKIYIDLSTTGTEMMERIDEGLRPTGIQFLDAPVSGGPAGGRKGTLSVMVAGPRAALERARPFMTSFAREIFHLAEKPGLAQIAKLINNHINTVGKLAAFEGMVLGQKAGLDMTALIDVINVSSGRNWSTMDKIPSTVLPRRFDPRASMNHIVKDAELFQVEAARYHMPLWIAPHHLDFLREAKAAGYGDRDNLRLIEYMEGLAGVKAPRSI